MDKLYFWRRFVDVLKADADGTPQDEYKIEDVPKILRERVKKITGLPDWKTNPGRSLKTLGDEIDAEATARANADDALAGNITAEVQARQAHEARTDNPHAVTAAQAGAVAKAGDTMTGRLTLSADPTTALHAVPLQYLQAILDARDPKENVRAATTANISLSGVQTVDGVSLAAGDRVLVKNQTTTSQNGLYLVASGAWSRTTDANTGAKISGMYVYVSEGTAGAETGWSLYTDGAITLDTTALTYGQTYGPGSVQAGAGLTRSGNQIALNTGEVPRGAVGTPADGQVWTFDVASGGWIPKAPAGNADMLELSPTEVSVTGTTTISTSGIGKMHVCSGSSYTLTLPSPSGAAGKTLGVRIAAGLTGLVTLSSSAGIDGQTTRIMWAGESAILLSDGSTWTKIAGRSRAMSGQVRLTNAANEQQGQLVPNTRITQVLCNTTDTNVGGLADAASNRVLIRRPGLYTVSAIATFLFGSASPRTIAYARRTSNGVDVVQSETSSGVSNVTPAAGGTETVSIAAADSLTLWCYHSTGSSRYLSGFVASYASAHISATEVVSW